MIKNKIIYILLSIYSFYSCSDKNINEKEHSTFNRTEVNFKKLKGQLIQIDSIKRPEEIIVIPEKKLFVIRDEDKYLAKAFNLGDFTIQKSFIMYGEGPDEQLSCFSLQYIKDENSIYSSDIFKRMIFSYPIHSIIKDESIVKPNEIIKLNTNYLIKPIKLNDKIVSLRNNSREGNIALLNFYNKQGDILFSNGPFPSTFLKYEPEHLILVTDVSINSSEDNKFLIASYSSTDIIDLLDEKGDLVKRVQGPDLFETTFKKDFVGQGLRFLPEKGSRRAYTGRAKMKNGNLYILYKGIYENPNDYHAKTLLHFNENLELQHAYDLQEPIFDFDINWSNMTLLGLTHLYEDKIVAYSIQ